MALLEKQLGQGERERRHIGYQHQRGDERAVERPDGAHHVADRHPADGAADELRGAHRRRVQPQRAGAEHASGGHHAVRRLRHRRGVDRLRDAHHLAVLRRAHRHADAGNLCAGVLARLARAVSQVGPSKGGKMKFILQSLAALVAGGFCFAAVAAEPPKIVMEEFMVPSKDTGIRLNLRNKHAQSAKKFSGDKILLFVHGATYPAETSFDLRLSGQSWMDYIARRGYDVYLVDVRGYGRSTRPPEM